MNLVIRGENLENLMLLPFFSTCNQPLTGTGFHHSLMEFFQFTDLAFIWHLENLSLFLIWSKTLVCFLKVLWLLKMAAKFFTISFTVQVWMLLLIEHILVLGPPKVIICVVGLWCMQKIRKWVCSHFQHLLRSKLLLHKKKWKSNAQRPKTIFRRPYLMI